MIIKKELNEFINEMEKILKEKYLKYKNTWLTVPIGVLREKMDEQIKSITAIFMGGVGYDKKEVIRRCVHVANYCFFICTILEERIKGKEEKHILFYLRKDKYGWASNLARSMQIIDGVVYRSNEDYYQIIKTKTKEISDWIKNAPNPYLAMVVGHGLRKKEAKENWDDIKVNIMLKGLRAKFNQNEYLKDNLLATGDAIIHEDSPTDLFWGVKGQDMLGKLLMQVREELKNK